MTDWFRRDDADDVVRDEDAENALPAHEHDDESTVGGGVMSQGGTAIDRGTGELGAHGGLVDEDAGSGAIVVPGIATGGAQAYTPALLEDENATDDEDGGVALPDA